MTRLSAAAVVSTIALVLSLSIDRIAARECTFYGVGPDTPLFTPEMGFSDYTVWYFDAAGEHIYDVIMADGVIVKSTADKFRKFLRDYEREYGPFRPGTFVYLNSGGGDLDGGLALGRLIREKRFNTAIGTLPSKFELPPSKPPYGGACLSSCTFTFLGGVERQVHAGDIYGVHRFRFEGAPQGDLADDAQIVGGELLAYVREMGVNQSLIEDMTASGPKAINHLSIARLRQLHVITSSKLLDGKLPDWMSCR